MPRGPKVSTGARRPAHYGYVTVKVPGHPRADRRGRVLEHILIVERALGHTLRATAPVHHFDRNRANNGNGNLVACDSVAYHRLLHLRQDALEGCGNPDHRRCAYCGRFDAIDAMVLHEVKAGPRYCHAECRKSYYVDRRGSGRLS